MSALDPLFGDVPGQEVALATLRAAAARPVHAYLLVGPAGTGKRRAARGFAAALLCEHGGCGTCASCTRALSGVHPDLIIAERSAVSYSVKDDIRPLTVAAQRRPLEAARTVVIVPDAHLMAAAAPALLKTLEEPPATTVFVLVADDLPREMVTIRSRCLVVPFTALSDREVAAWLIERGIDEQQAATLAEGSGGDAERAMLLASDPGFADRLERWRRVPDELDGSGATAVRLATELHASLAGATVSLEAAHAKELSVLEAQAEAMGERSIPGRRDIIDRHKREIRRFQNAELRAGLGVLARRYRDEMRTAAIGGGPRAADTMLAATESVDRISACAHSLSRNPRQPLALEHLLLSLR